MKSKHIRMIKRRFKESKLPQIRFCTKAGVHASAFSDMLKGRRRLTPAVAVKLGKFFEQENLARLLLRAQADNDLRLYNESVVAERMEREGVTGEDIALANDFKPFND